MKIRNPLPHGELTMLFVVLCLAFGIWAGLRHGFQIWYFPTGRFR